MATTGLVRYEAACRALAAAKTVAEVQTIRHSAAALRAYARVAKNRDLEIDAMEIRLRSERKVGELMARQRETVGLAKPPGVSKDRGNKSPDLSNLPTLAEAGIDKDLAKRARLLARIEADAFDEQIAAWRARVLDSRDPLGALVIRTASDAGKPRTATTPAMPVGAYRALVIDPPWPMTKSDRIETPEQGSRLDYPTMSVNEIGDLGQRLIGKCAAADAHLYLWVTHRFLRDGLALLEQWAFTYHCVLTWVKPSGFTPFSFMFNTEHVLFAYRGTFEVARKGLKVAFNAPAKRHSEKPDAFYDLVEQASPGPWISLFGRQGRPGWTVWGDEVNADAVSL